MRLQARAGTRTGIGGWRETARPDPRRRVNVGAPVQQQPRDLNVTVFRRDVEARTTGLGRQKECGEMRVRGTVRNQGHSQKLAIYLYLST